ncbi:Site-specific DNA recombinase [Lutibacter oricola]|uniref:Site-specific DNA recombinase n=1 Tax=Lutibacter oricola TaxID=762486 RepID=A0A1H2WNM3_9FLAO|nr:recombinase family protein [Lutibacter oricola]SDW82191.1 Site-specific DNA recombinase [Lutibacter oricola]
MIQTQQLRYFLYARKSSESEDRQMASIDDQLKEVNKIAVELDLQVVGVFSESKSAKEPGRKAFNEMLSEIEQGKADGILCWKLNRLARNPVDGGKISWMLQQHRIKHIQCYGRDYKPSDNVLMMQVEFGMANQFIKDLSTDIRRGVASKAERGWYPSSTLPIGYIHHKENRQKVHKTEIIPDKKKFHLVEKLWSLMLTGNYSIADIKRIGDELGFLGKNKHEYSKSSYHSLFSNEFYCGYFYWKDGNGIKKRYKGKHQVVVTEKEFDQIQSHIGNRKRQTRPKKYDFPYRGMISCGECGCSITAERKYQVRCTTCRFKFSCLNRGDCPKCGTEKDDMNNPTIIDITYYRCTKRKQKCSQKFISKKELEQQFLKAFEKIKIPKDFYLYMCEGLQRLDTQAKKKNKELITPLKKHITTLENRRKNLALMRADNEITNEEFVTFKEQCDVKIRNLQKQIRAISHLETNWLSIARDYAFIAENASDIFKKSDNLTKKSLLLKIGSNQQLIDKKLYFITTKPLLAILDCYSLFESQKERFEPKNHLDKQSDLMGLNTQNSVWWTQLNKVRTSLIHTINQ